MQSTANPIFSKPLGFKPFPSEFKEDISVLDILTARDNLKAKLKRELEKGGYLLEIFDWTHQHETCITGGGYNKYYHHRLPWYYVFYVFYDEFQMQVRVFLIFSCRFNRVGQYIAYDQNDKPFQGAWVTLFPYQDLDEGRKVNLSVFNLDSTLVRGRLPSRMNRFGQSPYGRTHLYGNMNVPAFMSYVDNIVSVPEDSRWRCTVVNSDNHWIYQQVALRCLNGFGIYGNTPYISSQPLNQDVTFAERIDWIVDWIPPSMKIPFPQIGENMQNSYGFARTFELKEQTGWDGKLYDLVKRQFKAYVDWIAESIKLPDWDWSNWEFEAGVHVPTSGNNIEPGTPVKHWDFNEIVDLLYSERVDADRVRMIKESFDKVVIPIPEEKVESSDDLSRSEKKWLERIKIWTDYINNIGWLVPLELEIYKRITSDFWEKHPEYAGSVMLCRIRDVSDVQGILEMTPVLGKYLDFRYDWGVIIYYCKDLKAFGRSEGTDLKFPSRQGFELIWLTVQKFLKVEMKNPLRADPVWFERPAWKMEANLHSFNATSWNWNKRTDPGYKFSYDTYKFSREFWIDLVSAYHGLSGLDQNSDFPLGGELNWRK